MLTLLELLIGLALFYLLVAVAASYGVEWIASYFNLRAKGLQRFIAQSFGEGAHIEQAPWARRFYEHPVIRSLFTPTARTLGTESPPSYIPASTFSTVLIDLLRAQLNRPAGEALQPADLTTLLANGQLPTGIAGALQAATSRGLDDIAEIRESLENWFDANMQRATGWYKRYTQIWLFAIALALATAFNLDSFYVARQLMRDPQLLAAVSETARTINPGDGTANLDDATKNIQLILARNTTLPQVAKTLEEPASDAAVRKAVLDLLTANFYNRVDGSQARELFGKFSQKPPENMLKAALALKKPSAGKIDCATSSESEQGPVEGDALDTDAGFGLLTCAISKAGDDANKLSAVETRIANAFRKIAADPGKTVDPRLGELAQSYLLAPQGQGETPLVALKTYLAARVQGADALRSELSRLQEKLPEIRWICDVAARWNTSNWFAAIAGWLTTALMASLGAPFWFELIGLLVNLRGVGTKPLRPEKSDVRT